MSININVWGTPETWVTSSVQYAALAEIKNAASDKNTYRKNYNSGSIPLNTLDLSPAFWGIGEGSVFCNPYYIAPYANNGDLSDPQIDVKPICEEIKTRPLLFTSSQISGANNQYDVRYAPDVTAVVQSNQSNSIITTSFNYQKVFAVPFVWYAASNYHNNSSTLYYWGLYEYFSTFDENTYPPYILGFGYRLYLGDAGSRTLGDAALLPYTIYDDVKGYEGSYNNVPFYARYGMQFPNLCCYTAHSNSHARSNLYKDQRVVRNATVGTADTGFRYKYCKSETTAVAWYFYEPDNPLWKVMIEETASGNTYWNPIPYIEVTAENKDDVYAYLLKQIAYLGLPFLYEDVISNYNPALGSEHYALPVFDEDGITTGEFRTGDAARLLPNSLWIDPRNSGYDPNKQPSSHGNIGDLSNSTRNRYSNAGGLAQWVVSQTTLIQLQAFLNGTYLPTSADLDADFKGTNPQQYIVSVQKYPYDIPYQGTQGDIYIGKINSGFHGYKLFPEFGGISVLPINSVCTENFGSINIYSSYGDFRDYLIKLILFLPFIGTVELDPRIYIGHSLSLIYTIDYNTGSVCAEIKLDGLTMETKNGQISITIPFMAADMGSYQNSLAQLDYSKELTKIRGIQTALTTGFQIGSAALGSYNTGSVPGLGQLSAITAGAMQLSANANALDNIDYQIEHTAPNIGTLSTANAANAFFMDPRARLLIVRPEMIPEYNPKQYSHTVGNACCKTGKLSNFRGYTQCASVVLDNITTQNGRAATEQELQLLRRALLNGIYL